MEVSGKKQGLRSHQRQRRHRTIIFSAADLFAERGFLETTMEEIAAKAEVSPPTIYNYFRSKSDILLGLLEVSKIMMEDALEKIAEDPVGDPIDVICEFIRIDLEDGYDFRQKKVWRMISAASLEAQGERLDAYLRLQSIFSKKLQKLIRSLQAKGKVPSDVNPVTAAYLLNAITRDSFRRYINVNDMTIEEMHANIREQIVLLWRGFRQ